MPPSRIPGPWHVPGLGAYLSIKNDAISYLTGLQQTYGDLVQFWVGPHKLLLLSSPEELHRISVDDARIYIDKTRLYESLHPILGLGLVTAGGELWKKHRKQMQPAFKDEVTGTVLPFFSRNTQTMLENLQQGQVVDISLLMRSLALKNIGSLICGQGIEDEHNIAWALPTALKISNERLYRAANLPLWFPTKEARTYGDALRRLERFVGEVRQREVPDSEHPCILGLLQESGFSEKEIRDELATTVMAGHETASLTLTWLWYLVGQHPEVEERLREEARLFSQPPTTLEDLNALPYTRRVVQEVLRLYPPSWWMGRTPSEDDELLGYEVRAGTMVSMSPYVVHRHPAFWDSPETFRPERFETCPVVGSYIPFMLGARRCAGQHVAMAELVLTVATMVRAHRFEVVDTSERRAIGKVQLRPSAPVMVRIHSAD